jgi:general stress protein YciG
MSTTTDHQIEAVGGVSLAETVGGAQGADVKSMPVSVNGLSVELLEELAALAAEKTAEGGLRLMGEGGLLPELAQHLMQSALEAEMDQHLAAEAGQAGGRGSRSGGNTRNGYRAKKVMTARSPSKSPATGWAPSARVCCPSTPGGPAHWTRWCSR